MKCIQQNVREERAILLDTLRKAALNGCLEYSRETAILESLIKKFKRVQISTQSGFRPEDVFSVASEWTESQALQGFPTVDSSSGPVEKIINGGGIVNLCRNIATALSHSYSPPALPEGMLPRPSGNSDWDWPFLLMRFRYYLILLSHSPDVFRFHWACTK